jgi:hypothetical protein
MVYSVVTTEPALTVILSGQFVAKQLQFVSSAEAKSWWPKLLRQLCDGNSCDVMLISHTAINWE